jgi:DNA-binding NarL/FixJ family response regulator
MPVEKAAGQPGDLSGAPAAGVAPPVSVLVVDDHRTFGEALAVVLDTHPRIRMTGVVAGVEEALAHMARTPSDAVVMDLLLSGVDGIEGTRRIRAAHPRSRVIILTGRVDAGALAAAVDAGAAAFLPKGGSLSDVVDAILAPPDSGLIIGAQTPLRVIGEAMGVRDRAAREHPHNSLTARELDVLDLLAGGLSPAQVAEQLGISLHTTRGHIKNLLAKLHAHSQLEAVVIAWQRGLIRPPGQGQPSG